MFEKYMNDIIQSLNTIDRILFYQILFQLRVASKKQRSIFLVGNGIDNHNVNHFTNDLIKVAMNHNNGNGKRGFKVFSLSECMPIVTAFSNDISFQGLYSSYLSNLAAAGDVLIIFESVKPHENLIDVALYGHENEMQVIAITGSEKREFEDYCDIIFPVRETDHSKVSTIQGFICHCLSISLKESLIQPVVFLDRDGVINLNRNDYVKNWQEFRFIEGSLEAVSLLNYAGYAVVIVTNQSAIARKKMEEVDLAEIHRKMVKSLRGCNANIAEIYYCAHHPDDLCHCRKPQPGLLKKAFRDLPLDRNSAVMIGDRHSDIMAGRNLGLKTILISADETGDGKADIIKPDLFSAAQYLLKQKGLSCEKFITCHS